MSKKSSKVGCQIPVVGLLGSIFTVIVGQTIHGSFFWGIIDFFFWPLIWIKWALYKQVNMSIIKESFSWFFV